MASFENRNIYNGILPSGTVIMTVRITLQVEIVSNSVILAGQFPNLKKTQLGNETLQETMLVV